MLFKCWVLLSYWVVEIWRFPITKNLKLPLSLCWIAILLEVYLLFPSTIVFSQELDKKGATEYVEPPYQLGKSIGKGSWELINLDGRVAGYGFETKPLAPLPGFSGAHINLFVSVTLEGRFINAEIISHNEPIFVSGLDGALFHNFVTQYLGYSITDTLVVGIPYGTKSAGSSLIYLDGVTKATASVRIAHETILAAAFAIARKQLGLVGSIQKVRPNLEYDETLTWFDLIEKGLVKRKLVTNADAQKAFAGTLWEDDDPTGNKNPQEPFLDLWVVDVGVPAIAKAVLTPNSVEILRKFQEISDNDEPILLIDAGRHGLVSKDFVRNTSPDLISLKQGGLPIALRDSDLEFEMLKGVPGNSAMIIRTDRRLGFDPTSDWNLTIRAVREYGSFRPEIGTQDFTVTHKTDIKFYNIEEKYIPLAPWKQAALQRLPDLTGVLLGIGLLFWLLFSKMSWLAS